MIDGASTYFMMCDNNLCITYVNPAVKAMFRKYQQDIRRYLPTFDVDRLIGQNIDQFHRAAPSTSADCWPTRPCCP
jgi:methyl-accepting chemotaxis protein